MKKSLLMCCIVVLLSANTSYADYEACYQRNGKNVCHSTLGMNWWSAWAWCDAKGMKLATWNDFCPNLNKTDSCMGLTHMAYQQSYHLNEPDENGVHRGYINKTGGGTPYMIYDQAVSRTTLCRALCIEK